MSGVGFQRSEGATGAFRHQVDKAADRTLTEQHRRRAAHDFDAVEIIGVGCDTGIVRKDVAHPVAELQRVDAANVEAVDAGVAAIGIGEHARGIFHRIEKQADARGFHLVFP